MDLNFGSSILLSSHYVQHTRDFETCLFPVWEGQACILTSLKKLPFCLSLVGHQEDCSSSNIGSVMYIEGPNCLYKPSQKPGMVTVGRIIINFSVKWPFSQHYNAYIAVQ